MGVDLGRALVDVDDLLVALRVPEPWMVFDHVDADADDEVRLVEAEGHIVARLQADRSEAERVAEWDHPLGHEGGRHRHV